jgi:L-ascorbate metabolism protein UlaG (beta-lactamase superfamily)
MAADFWLIDPVFSQRASPFKFFGPKRFHLSPITIEQLPYIKGVIISHNHYDHLDKASIKALCKKTDFFLAPLGVNGDLERWGVKPSQITTFDWWQELQIDNTLLSFTPAHHYSGRWLNDNSSTLWGSWVIQYNNQKLFFSGDSGYFDGFKEIGDKYGPFDVCLIETGAYDAQWPLVHMQPEQSLQSFIDLNGRYLMPIHNATFDLAFHAWYDPMVRISKLAAAKNIKLLMPIFGQVVTVNQPLKPHCWWQQHERE